MKFATTTTLAALALAVGGAAQTGFGFTFPPTPFFQLVAGVTVPGTTVESIHHVKLSNNGDGEWTTALALGALEAAWGGDGASRGVHIIRYNPTTFAITSTTEANALNSSDDDIHLALSADGLTAIFERKPLPAGLTTVMIATRAAVGTAFGAPVPVAGFPFSGLSSGEFHPYIGTVGGVDKCFYADGTDLVMQDIDIAGATLMGAPVVVANPAQVGTQGGSPSPLIGGDGDVEALWACDIVIPQTAPGTGDADPVLHNDLLPSTPGMVRVQRSDWQGWGSLAGGLISFSHDILGFHAMHGEGAILIGDAELPGGTVDIRTQGMNLSAPNPLMGFVLFAPAPGPTSTIPGWNHVFALSGPLAPTVLTTSTTAVDGIGDASFVLPSDPALSGVSAAIQAVIVDMTLAKFTWSNTAWVHVL